MSDRDKAEAALKAAGYERQDQGLYALPYTGIGVELDAANVDYESIDDSHAVFIVPHESVADLVNHRLKPEEKDALNFFSEGAHAAYSPNDELVVRYASVLKDLLQRMGGGE